MDPDLMGGVISPVVERGGKPARKNATAFDVVTRLVLPLVLVLIAGVREQQWRFWGIIGFAALCLVASFCRPLVAWVGGLARRRMDERIARRALPELRKFVGEFGGFVDRSRADTLHYIAQSDVCGGDSGRFNKLALPNVNLFHDLWSNLGVRAENQKPDLTNFRATIMELNTLISSYNTYCTRAVFEMLPQELRSQLSDRAKSSLEAWRERFVDFLNDYTKYRKRFDEGFAARYLSTRDFPRPKPL